MRKNAVLLIISAMLVLGGCASTEGDRESGTEGATSADTTSESDSGQESAAMPPEESDIAYSEAVPYEGEEWGIPEVEIDYDNLIDEREALDLAYYYLYADSVYSGYGVYCDALFHSRSGYVVVQFAYDKDSYTPIYETYDPDKDLMPGRLGRIELLYDGLSENELFYTFWLCGYIRDDESGTRRTTYDYVAVSIDGKIIECERTDAEGNDRPIEKWGWYHDLISL